MIGLSLAFSQLSDSKAGVLANPFEFVIAQVFQGGQGRARADLAECVRDVAQDHPALSAKQSDQPLFDTRAADVTESPHDVALVVVGFVTVKSGKKLTQQAGIAGARRVDDLPAATGFVSLVKSLGHVSTKVCPTSSGSPSRASDDTRANHDEMSDLPILVRRHSIRPAPPPPNGHVSPPAALNPDLSLD
jgi:hypothetical protein